MGDRYLEGGIFDENHTHIDSNPLISGGGSLKLEILYMYLLIREFLLILFLI